MDISNHENWKMGRMKNDKVQIINGHSRKMKKWGEWKWNKKNDKVWK